MDPWFPRGVKYEKLMKYTDNFSNENFIGTFQYGKIYRALIPGWHRNNHHHMVVKIWNTSNSEIRDNELRHMREIILLRNERVKWQPAIPPLYLYVNDSERFGIIYEFKAINTVRNQLCEDDFTWVRRIKVILWFARLLKFFHRRFPPYGPFIVNNVDASHILVDQDYVPRLFDFSLMTGGGIFPNTPRSAAESSSQFTGEGTEHGDIFAFGLLVWSLISKKSISKDEAVESISTHGWKWSLSEWKATASVQGNKKVGLSLVHGSFEAEEYFYAPDGSEISSLAIQCLHPSLEERPSMNQVVRRLQKLQTVRSHGDLVAFKPRPRFRS